MLTKCKARLKFQSSARLAHAIITSQLTASRYEASKKNASHILILCFTEAFLHSIMLSFTSLSWLLLMFPSVRVTNTYFIFSIFAAS